MNIKLKSKENLNELLIKKGFSKRQFAEKSGVTVSTFIQISNEKRSPRPNTAKKICEALNCEFDDLFEIEYQKADAK